MGRAGWLGVRCEAMSERGSSEGAAVPQDQAAEGTEEEGEESKPGPRRRERRRQAHAHREVSELGAQSEGGQGGTRSTDHSRAFMGFSPKVAGELQKIRITAPT